MIEGLLNFERSTYTAIAIPLEGTLPENDEWSNVSK